MLDQETINELELAIDFGQRLLKYKKSNLQKMLSSISNNDKVRQFYEHDRAYVNDIIRALETGENIIHMHPIKNRLTVVGQMFFKAEFKKLKLLTSI